MSIPLYAQVEGDELDLLSLQVDPDPKQEQLLQTMSSRRTMLNWHNYTGWAATALMIAASATGPDGTISNTHKWLGITAGSTYLASALLAYIAPKPAGIKDSRSISWHKKLMYIHGPAMFMSMITGFAIHNDRKKGRSPSGLANTHKPFSSIATVAMGLSLGVTLYEF